MSATVGPLLSRIARLEQAVASLQGQAGGGESLSPNYLTLGVDGEVGANFTGVVNALGLTLPAGVPLAPGPANEISWVRTADGDVVAVLTADTSGALSLRSIGSPANHATSAALQTTDSRIAARDRATGVPASVQANAGIDGASPVTVTIVDENGESNFAQLATASELFIDGPHSVAIPALAAGQQFSVGFNTTRAAWASAMVVGGISSVGSPSIVLFGGGVYLGGASWNVQGANSNTAASTPVTAVVFVVGA